MSTIRRRASGIIWYPPNNSAPRLHFDRIRQFRCSRLAGQRCRLPGSRGSRVETRALMRHAHTGLQFGPSARGDSKQVTKFEIRSQLQWLRRPCPQVAPGQRVENSMTKGVRGKRVCTRSLSRVQWCRLERGALAAQICALSKNLSLVGEGPTSEAQ
jgi:hypothetical protein